MTPLSESIVEISRQSIPYIVPLIIATVISVALALQAWRRHTKSGALVFALLMVAVAEWSLGYALELNSSVLSGKIFWGKVQYLGIVITPIAWLVFSLQYTNRAGWLTPRYLILLLVVPVITLSLVWTTELHGLVWQEMSLDPNSSFPALMVSYGAWFWVHLSFSYVLLFLGSFWVIKLLLRLPHLYRSQAFLLLFAALAPWLGNALYILRLMPVPHLDPTPFAFTLSGMAFGFNLFQFRLLDIVPVARQAVLDVMSDGVIVLDAQNRIVDLNPAAQQMIGSSSSKVVGRTGTQALSNWPRLLEHYRNMVEGQAEVVLTWPGKPKRYLDMRISPLYNRRKYLKGRIIVLRDITERKQAEESLARARDQALEISRLKSEILTRVSHELRTPLGAILGFAELLEMGVYGPLLAEQTEPIQKIIDSTLYLTNLVNEIMDQAKLEAGKLELDIASLNLVEMMNDMQSKMVVLAQAKGLNLTTEIAAGMPIVILTDRHRLRQILINLVGNAIKFTDAGSVHVCVYRLDFGHWAIRVSDTGPGIPVEAQTRIFEPFRQVDGSITRVHGGTGLGLSIVKQLTTMMGGEVALESKLGQGCSFTIQLPFLDSQEAERNKPVANQS
jgi:PAS domain S-box-containing protein